MHFLTPTSATLVAALSALSTAGEPPRPDQRCTCMTSQKSPATWWVSEASHHFGNKLKDRQCGKDAGAGCITMYHDNGLKVSACGPGAGNESCTETAAKLAWIAEACDQKLGKYEYAGGSCWMGEVDSGVWIHLGSSPWDPKPYGSADSSAEDTGCAGVDA